MTNDEKRAVLLEYRRLEARIDRALAERRRWQEREAWVNPVCTDIPAIPANGRRTDMHRNAAKRITEIENEINRDIRWMTMLRQSVEQSIQTVPNEQLRDILRRRYIDGDRMEKIAEDLSLDCRWVRRLHARALANLTLVSPPRPAV